MGTMAGVGSGGAVKDSGDKQSGAAEVLSWRSEGIRGDVAVPAHLGCKEAVADGCLNVGRNGSKGIVGRIQNIAVFDRLLPLRRQLRVHDVD